MIATADLVVRLATATAAGALVGIEREARGQLTGMRTHALVSIGACLFTIAGAYGLADLREPANDPMRVAAQIVSGIGFIGAGTILRDGATIRGITTAAALWTSAALGLASGAGMYTAVALGMAAVLFVLIGLRFVRDHLLRRLTRQYHPITLSYARGHGTLGPVVAAIEAVEGQVTDLRINDDDEMRHVRLVIRLRSDEHLRAALETLADRPEVVTIDYA